MTDAVHFEAIFFDGLSSRPQPAQATVDGETLVVRPERQEQRYALSTLKVQPPLGRLRRVIRLPGGARLESDDQAAIAQLERRLHQNGRLWAVQRLEARWQAALLSVVGVVLFGVLFVLYGLPALAKAAAALTPPPVLTSLDRQTVRLVDNEYLQPSTLGHARQQQLSRAFRQLAAEAGGPYHYRLLFRDGGRDVGANAFALPDGSVFVTDQLVRLAHSDQEILGVLAHELGHVKHRHAMQSVYSGLGLTLMISVVAGDVTSAATVAGAIPAVLLQGKYSRQMESQADADAGHWLMRHGGTTRPLQDILQRLVAQDEDSKTHSRVLDLLASHPGVEARVAQLKAIEAESGR
ncbi:M48 family metallopeptidase [Deinococcus sonorensis]|uniref:M48 family metallopeptidase n=2 Tax=Deinococcus sonorensis TaxID=309891 RepID=A0AAU7U8M5_9DEIO